MTAKTNTPQTEDLSAFDFTEAERQAWNEAKAQFKVRLDALRQANGTDHGTHGCEAWQLA
jgi:hypothetical protein